MKKYFLSLCLLIGILISVQTTAKADTINLLNSSTEKNISLSESMLNDFRSKESKEALEYLKENSLETKLSESYIKFTKDANGELHMDSRQYSKNEYETLNKIKPRTFPQDSTVENSWMRLIIEINKLSTGRYRFYLFYDWKTRPFFTANDMIAIGYDSNLTFDRTTASSVHEQIIINPSTYEETYSVDMYDYNSSDNYKGETHGIAFKFNLPSSPDLWPTYYHGFLTAEGGFSNTQHISANMTISYSHQQLGFNYDLDDVIEFLSTGDINVKIALFDDVFQVSDEFKRF